MQAPKLRFLLSTMPCLNHNNLSIGYKNKVSTILKVVIKGQHIWQQTLMEFFVIAVKNLFILSINLIYTLTIISFIPNKNAQYYTMHVYVDTYISL